MPKKRQHFKPFKPASTASPTPGSSSNAAGKAPRSVNELLASLRHASLDPSAPRQLPPVTPSVPPALREILQIPDTPVPAPRRQHRLRLDNNGRRLPAGPPPPRSWVASRSGATHPQGQPSRSTVSRCGLVDSALPGTYLPASRSLIDIILRRIAVDWDIHRVYHQHYLFYIPAHLKSALIRWIGIASPGGLSVEDLRLILLSSPDDLEEAEDDELSEYHYGHQIAVNPEVNYLDLSGALGRSLTLKEVSDLLFPSKKQDDAGEPQESWEESESIPSPPRALLPNLTHLSLALDPQLASEASWRQLLALSSKLTTVTHLSLAYWPIPTLTPRARRSTVATPQGQNIAYGGTSYYSHSIDHDWSEALLVLKMLSRNLYALEFLDLTGCAPWFKALMLQSDHDYVDWVGAWGKVTLLRILTGWTPGEDALPSELMAYREAVDVAASVEKYIRAMRAGKGRIITVERNRLDT
ncbi:hypothetical protein MKX07_008406 [Trichoderma sp. CBMAI-0711]|uniref:Tafazzin n=1 Tax=Trichoderma parareesei TaxID=858221 RepID=A0A2H2Z0B7_TRIPA|nr:hypothetical protein MKX07_008406 [Trichoderma sp. CBMAI-0711]OTA01533.1 hypothetical protein A9Z42_0018470 [Trichoderma parareesei]